MRLDLLIVRASVLFTVVLVVLMMWFLLKPSTPKASLRNLFNPSIDPSELPEGIGGQGSCRSKITACETDDDCVNRCGGSGFVCQLWSKDSIQYPSKAVPSDTQRVCVPQINASSESTVDLQTINQFTTRVVWSETGCNGSAQCWKTMCKFPTIFDKSDTESTTQSCDTQIACTMSSSLRSSLVGDTETKVKNIATISDNRLVQNFPECKDVQQVGFDTEDFCRKADLRIFESTNDQPLPVGVVEGMCQNFWADTDTGPHPCLRDSSGYCRVDRSLPSPCASAMSWNPNTGQQQESDSSTSVLSSDPMGVDAFGEPLFTCQCDGNADERKQTLPFVRLPGDPYHCYLDPCLAGNDPNVLYDIGLPSVINLDKMECLCDFAERYAPTNVWIQNPNTQSPPGARQILDQSLNKSKWDAFFSKNPSGFGFSDLSSVAKWNEYFDKTYFRNPGWSDWDCSEETVVALHPDALTSSSKQRYLWRCVKSSSPSSPSPTSGSGAQTSSVVGLQKVTKGMVGQYKDTCGYINIPGICGKDVTLSDGENTFIGGTDEEGLPRGCHCTTGSRGICTSKFATLSKNPFGAQLKDFTKEQENLSPLFETTIYGERRQIYTSGFCDSKLTPEENEILCRGETCDETLGICGCNYERNLFGEQCYDWCYKDAKICNGPPGTKCVSMFNASTHESNFRCYCFDCSAQTPMLGVFEDQSGGGYKRVVSPNASDLLFVPMYDTVTHDFDPFMHEFTDIGKADHKTNKGEQCNKNVRRWYAKKTKDGKYRYPAIAAISMYSFNSMSQVEDVPEWSPSTGDFTLPNVGALNQKDSDVTPVQAFEVNTVTQDCTYSRFGSRCTPKSVRTTVEHRLTVDMGLLGGSCVGPSGEAKKPVKFPVVNGNENNRITPIDHFITIQSSNSIKFPKLEHGWYHVPQVEEILDNVESKTTWEYEALKTKRTGIKLTVEDDDFGPDSLNDMYKKYQDSRDPTIPWKWNQFVCKANSNFNEKYWKPGDLSLQPPENVNISLPNTDRSSGTTRAKVIACNDPFNGFMDKNVKLDLTYDPRPKGTVDVNAFDSDNFTNARPQIRTGFVNPNVWSLGNQTPSATSIVYEFEEQAAAPQLKPYQGVLKYSKTLRSMTGPSELTNTELEKMNWPGTPQDPQKTCKHDSNCGSNNTCEKGICTDKVLEDGLNNYSPYEYLKAIGEQHCVEGAYYIANVYNTQPVPVDGSQTVMAFDEKNCYPCMTTLTLLCIHQPDEEPECD